MDSLFFYISKIGWALVSPGSLMLFLCIGTWFTAWRGKAAASRKFAASTAVCMLTVGFFPVGEWLISPLESRFPSSPALPSNVEGIIVLGGAISPVLSMEWRQPQLNEAADRLTNFYYLAGLYPRAQLVFSGGSGSLTRQNLKEADPALDFFNQLNLNDRAIVYESDSRNTAENVSNTKALLNPRADENWILVTSAFHMPRAVGVFCRQGWPVTPYPVDHRSLRSDLLRLEFDLAENLALLKTATREWLGLAAYRVAGHTNGLLPHPKDDCGVGSN
ncbi:MAG: YdcF family protein [Pseudohongiellaceae bacterium]